MSIKHKWASHDARMCPGRPLVMYVRVSDQIYKGASMDLVSRTLDFNKTLYDDLQTEIFNPMHGLDYTPNIMWKDLRQEIFDVRLGVSERMPSWIQLNGNRTILGRLFESYLSNARAGLLESQLQ